MSSRVSTRRERLLRFHIALPLLAHALPLLCFGPDVAAAADYVRTAGYNCGTGGAQTIYPGDSITCCSNARVRGYDFTLTTTGTFKYSSKVWQSATSNTWLTGSDCNVHSSGQSCAGDACHTAGAFNNDCKADECCWSQQDFYCMRVKCEEAVGFFGIGRGDDCAFDRWALTFDALVSSSGSSTCDASTAPTNGGVGTCTSTLASGSTCQPTCNSGYTVSGTSSCDSGNLYAATCVRNTCDASTAPTNGGVGTCTSSLAGGSTCQPTCNSGYVVSGVSSCSAATSSSTSTLSAATCVATSSGDCKCTCCSGNFCLPSVAGLFNAGSSSACNAAACRTRYSGSCPASGSSGSVSATYTAPSAQSGSSAIISGSTSIDALLPIAVGIAGLVLAY